MTNIFDGIMGTSAAALLRGLRLGFLQYKIAARQTSTLVNALEPEDLARLPVKSLDQLMRGRKASVQVDVQSYEEGGLQWFEALALASLIRVENPAAVLEIGTFMGYTTMILARNLPNAVVHTLDLPLDFKTSGDPVTDIPKDDFHLISNRRPGREFLDTPEQARIRQHFGDSRTWDYRQAAGATCFFIDGSHTYEYAKSDTEKCLELCGGKGLFFWHDCNKDHPGVIKFLREWLDQGHDLVRIQGTSLAYWNTLDRASI